MPEQSVVRNEEQSRYEVLVDGALTGFAEFRGGGERIVFTHTETLADFQGQGLGLVLAERALADAVSRGEVIVPVCPFFQRYLQRHDVPGAQVEWPGE
jgi:predicted GNAT family acetyltransferase